jgi:4-hydroxythreonine-4-phosphate dehydrogenase
MNRVLAVTVGEPAGIGPDITIKSWLRRKELNLAPFYVVGDARYLAQRADEMGTSIPVKAVVPRDAAAVFGAALPVVDCGEVATAKAGHPDASSAPVAIAAIRLSVAHVMAGEASAVVTNPVAKNVLYRSGFSEPGHTEYLAKLATQATGKPAQAVMMLWSPELAVVPVTIHLPLRNVFGALDTEIIVQTGRIVAGDLRSRFGIQHPRLAVAGLNPHAGEDGTMGAEDRDIVAPAIAILKAEGIDVRGPLPADTMFHPGARATYDVALCMYHDQALIPIKTLAFDHAVNVTLGLPFVRTSPDHGTAFDIAGTGRADPSSFIAAVTLAARLAIHAQPELISALQ